jgi:hypothetical protein
MWQFHFLKKNFVYMMNFIINFNLKRSFFFLGLNFNFHLHINYNLILYLIILYDNEVHFQKFLNCFKNYHLLHYFHKF